jgi:hypothetical protein
MAEVRWKSIFQFISDTLTFFITGTEEALYVLSVGGAAFTNIDSDIKDCAFDTTNEFALGKRRALEMQTSHHAIRGFALIVLDKGYCVAKDWSNFLVELSLREGLEEIASSVFEDAGLYNDYAINGGFDYFHII